MKYSRWLLAYGLYYIGAFFSWLCHKWDWTCWFAYRPYQLFMSWSIDAQGASDFGPWAKGA